MPMSLPSSLSSNLRRDLNSSTSENKSGDTRGGRRQKRRGCWRREKEKRYVRRGLEFEVTILLRQSGNPSLVKGRRRRDHRENFLRDVEHG